MGFFDYVSDIYSSLSIQSAAADASEDQKHASGDFNSDDDHSGIGNAQHRGAATKGGATPSVPHSGTNEESAAEAEVNKADQKTGGESSEPGHKPGDGGAGSGQVGKDNAGPHGKPVGSSADDDEEAEEEPADDEADEEEEEEDDEPVDPMPKLIEACEKSQECAPLKHHYDHCVERVTSQHEQHGKAHEDCVEEFFHLAHCATQCAAPKLFKQLR